MKDTFKDGELIRVRGVLFQVALVDKGPPDERLIRIGSFNQTKIFALFPLLKGSSYDDAGKAYIPPRHESVLEQHVMCSSLEEVLG